MMRTKRQGPAVALVVSLALSCGYAAAGPAAAVAPPAWRVVPSPNPSALTVNGLRAVACASATTCFAVGHRGSQSLIEQGNGSRWSIIYSPNRAGASGALNAVTCPSATSCFAVGDLIEHWSGTHWSIMPSPNALGSVETTLNGVACPTMKSCFAVGSYLSGSGSKSLVKHWNGRHWAIMPTPDPSGSSQPTLLGVSCPTPINCFAVGDTGSRTLVEHWNGKDWGVMGRPAPSGSSSSDLRGVSCPTVINCFAVGSFVRASNARSLVEHWNGRSWGIMENRTPPFVALNGVACVTTISCFAVGTSVTSVVEHWNGKHWGTMAIANSPGEFSGLDGVTCQGARRCFAAGSQTAHAPSQTLVARYV
jgi:hypothetical protein